MPSFLYIVCWIQLLQFPEGINLDNVVKGTLTDHDFILVHIGFQRHLIPVLFLSARRVVHICNMLPQLCTVLRRPLRKPNHLMAVCPTHRYSCDSFVLCFKAPVVRHRHGNSKIICTILVFGNKLLIAKKHVPVKNVSIL